MKVVLTNVVSACICALLAIGIGGLSAKATVAAELPSDIQLLTYIQSGGNEYIDTGVKFNSATDEVEIDFEMTDYSTTTANGIFGSRIASANENYTLQFTSQHHILFGCRASSASTSYQFRWETGAVNKRYVIRISQSSRSLTDVATSQVLTSDVATSLDSFSSTKNAYLFWSNVEASWLKAKMKLYGCKIWREGDLLHDFVPCRALVDGVETVCLYDKETKGFYKNKGTGSFTAGPEQDTPEDPEDPGEDPVEDPESGTTLYVAMNGNDSSGNGKEDAPYASIAKAITVAGQGNTTIYVKDGTYVIGSRIDLTTPGKEIHIEGFSKDPTRVILKTTSSRMFHNDGVYCEFKYLTFTTANSDIKNTVVLIKDGRISNCIFTNCKSSTGGNIFMTRNAVIENCLFYGNSGKAQCGQLYCIADGNTTGNPCVVNCTFVDSSGAGGVAMSWDNGAVINCVEWTGGVVAMASGTTAPVNSRYFNCAGDFARSGASVWTQLTASPFVDAATGNYAIPVNSPLCAVGDVTRYSSAATSETDLAGNPRIAGGKISIGAYEADSTALPVISARVDGWDGFESDASHACTLTISDPLGGVGCDVKWAWTDSGEFTHDAAEQYSAVGTYTNVVRITCEGYTPYQGMGIVRIESNSGEDPETGEDEVGSRWRYWLGVDNVRDFGGMTTTDGRTVRTNRIYRTQAFNDNAICDWLTAARLKAKYEGYTLWYEFGRDNADELVLRFDHNNLAQSYQTVAAALAADRSLWRAGAPRGTAESRAAILAETGLKTEIDLRSTSECYGMTGSPLGASVNWVNLPSDGTGAWYYSAEGKAFFKACFPYFLNEANYPIAFHCIAGADRTGCLAYILGALLGIGEPQLLEDYEMTSLSSSGARNKSSFQSSMRALTDHYSGSTLYEKMSAYAADCGFTGEDIATFRSLVLKPAKQ